MKFVIKPKIIIPLGLLLLLIIVLSVILVIKLQPKIDYYKNNTIPVYYINLDKDIEREKLIQPILSQIFGKKNVNRIPGVLHKDGMQGVRLAHIKAHTQAISNSALEEDDYYLICEDDLIPLETT